MATAGTKRELARGLPPRSPRISRGIVTVIALCSLSGLHVLINMDRLMTHGMSHIVSTVTTNVIKGQQTPKIASFVNACETMDLDRPRKRLTLYEDLEKSSDFTVLHMASPKEDFARFHPKVSARDCNRTNLLGRIHHKMEWILWGNQNQILTAEQQHEDCLSILEKRPRRHGAEDQPLFLARAERVQINGNGVVRSPREDLYFKRTCFGTTKLRDFDRNCSCDVLAEEVFVASQWWGDGTGHFIGETLPRIVSYLPYARRMPVHLYGGNTKQIQTWFNYLNLTFIYGTVCAQTAYVSSPSDCRGGAYMKNMLLKTREVLALDYKPEKVLLMYRDQSRSSREPLRNITELKFALERAGYSDIDIVLGSDSSFWSCIPCQMELYSKTWLFIAAHGAGIMNIQFLSAGARVVEIASAERPEEPIYSNLEQRAHALGLHFYHYYWQSEADRTKLDVPFFVSELLQFAPPGSDLLMRDYYSH